MTITKNKTRLFQKHLQAEEKSPATVEKYLKDTERFAMWLGGRPLNKENVLCYKQELVKNYAPASVNAAISSINSFLEFDGRRELKIKSVRIQRQVFALDGKDLSKQEYKKLIASADERLSLLMQTVCATGIRVSELSSITIEAVKAEKVDILCKGKLRTVILPEKLCRMLLKYASREKIFSGCVFRSRNGNPLDRSNIWTDMKKLCEKAGIPREKVFPHNLRHLFAKTYYSSQRDIVRLADILGHSSINTTRIYTMEGCEIHRKNIESLGLLVN